LILFLRLVNLLEILKRDFGMPHELRIAMCKKAENPKKKKQKPKQNSFSHSPPPELIIHNIWIRTEFVNAQQNQYLLLWPPYAQYSSFEKRFCQKTLNISGPSLGDEVPNPKFIYDENVLLFGTDPVAVDAVAHDMIVKERMARGTQQVDAGGRSAFLQLAEGLGLGVAARDKIKIADVKLE
jgi:hypothetical protein